MQIQVIASLNSISATYIVTFIEIDHEFIFMVILPLLLIHEGQQPVFSNVYAQLLVNCLEDYVCPGKSVSRLTWPAWHDHNNVDWAVKIWLNSAEKTVRWFQSVTDKICFVEKITRRKDPKLWWLSLDRNFYMLSVFILYNFPYHTYRIWPNYCSYPYKRTVKQFCSLQITASVLFVYFFVKAYKCMLRVPILIASTCWCNSNEYPQHMLLYRKSEKKHKKNKKKKTTKISHKHH